jgi:HPt (histidine-containing phosphotransfer) domain-containing protein
VFFATRVEWVAKNCEFFKCNSSSLSFLQDLWIKKIELPDNYQLSIHILYKQKQFRYLNWNSIPMLDIKIIEKLKKASAKRRPDFLESLINQFLSHSQSLVNEIKNAHQEDDLLQMSKAAHKLKGSAGCFGASKLSLLSEKIENHCANHNKAQIDLLINQLEQCYLNTHEQLLIEFTTKT